MRILITGVTGESMPPPYGGIPKVCLLYARTWKQMGHDVALTFAYRPAHSDDFGANVQYFFEYAGKPNVFRKLAFLLRYFFKNPPLYVGLLRSYFRVNPTRFSNEIKEAFLHAAYGVFLDGIIVSFKPDIVLSEMAYVKTFMAAQVAKRRKIPVVYDVYAEVHAPVGVNVYLKGEALSRYWETFLDLSEFVVGINNCAAGALTYLPKEKVKVFYDTCDFTLCRMDMSETRADLRAHFTLPKEQFLIGAVGAFDFRKGHDHLIKAVASLAKTGMDVGAVICGAGDKAKWQALAQEEGVADRVHFFSRLSELDLAKLYRSLDLYVNLSNTPRSCGLDLALLEAMASGLPIIVYDNGALPEAVPAGENGRVIPTDDIQGVAAAIRELHRLPSDARLAMGRKSADIASKCDIHSTAAIKLNWFKEAVAHYHTRP